MILPDSTIGWDSKTDRTKRASLDRVDCSLGYVRGNVRFVSVIANYARMNFTDEELVGFCHAVAETK